MRNSVFETLLGAAVILVAGAFLMFSLSSAPSGGGGESYLVKARFNSVVGIDRGSDVRMAGIKVGRVVDLNFDTERYEAVLTLSIDNAIELPDDSDAKVTSDGLLGGAFLAVEPGGGFDVIAQDGSGEILYTRGSVDLLTLFASFASSGGSGEE